MRFAEEQKRLHPNTWRKILSVSEPSASDLERYASPLDADTTFRANVGKILHQRTWTLKPYVFGGDSSGDAAIVALTQGEELICSGTLIGTNRVLTAAHCLCDASHFVARFGEYAFFAGPTEIEESSRHTPPGQGCPVNYALGDIAILHLSAPAPANLVPAVVDEASTWSEQTLQLEVVGYGLTEAGSAGQRRRALVGIARSRCDVPGDALVGNSGCAGEQEMILGEIGGTIDTCNGDSGGPALMPVRSHASSVTPRQIVGVTSRGLGALACGNGGIYVRLDGPLASWIASDGESSGGDTR
jgi:secreted trypsin-like serine protease